MEKSTQSIDFRQKSQFCSTGDQGKEKNHLFFSSLQVGVHIQSFILGTFEIAEFSEIFRSVDHVKYESQVRSQQLLFVQFSR